jgi:hypothetical protein
MLKNRIKDLEVVDELKKNEIRPCDVSYMSKSWNI